VSFTPISEIDTPHFITTESVEPKFGSTPLNN